MPKAQLTVAQNASPTDADLIAAARSVIKRRDLHKCHGGQVGAAILTVDGSLHLGVCLDAPCALGFCAETAAVAAMVTAGESQIAATVAVAEDGSVLPPCGRCRELLALLDPANAEARILLSGGRATTLAALMPESGANL
ncbi:MAG: cytidine deaminase [Pseudomonadota bacterium]